MEQQEYYIRGSACFLYWRQRKKPTLGADEKSDRKWIWSGSQKPDTHGFIGESNFEFNSKKPLEGFKQEIKVICILKGLLWLKYRKY